MKIPLVLIASLILFTFSSAAQPEITLEDFTPEYSTQIGFQKVEFLEQGEGGESLVWDFSGSEIIGDTLLYIVEDPTDQEALWYNPNCTHFFRTIFGPEFEQYWELENDTAQIVAWHVPVLGDPVEYLQENTRFVFPLVYSNTFSDTSHYVIGIGQSAGGREEYSNVEVDSYGTLITPAGTFENVLRVKYSIDGIATEYGWGTTNSSEYSLTRWVYLNSEYPHCLAEFERYIEESDTTYKGLYFDSSIVSKIGEFPDSQLSLSVYPSPADEFVTVVVNTKNALTVRIELKAVDGKVVAEWGTHQFSHTANEIKLNLPQLTSGIYYLHVFGEKESGIKRILIR